MRTISETHDEPAHYAIRLKGHLDEWRNGWFENLRLTRESDGTTLLCGWMDQSALHGLLRKVCDLGIILLSVMRTEPDDVLVP